MEDKFFGIKTASCHEHCTRPDLDGTLWTHKADLITRYGGGGPKMALKSPKISDESMKASLQKNQLALMDKFGIDVAVFTARASWSLLPPGAPRRVVDNWTRVSKLPFGNPLLLVAFFVKINFVNSKFR